MRIGVIFLLLLFCLFFPGYGQGDDDGRFLAEIEKRVTELMKQGNIPGLSLVIVRGQESTYVKGFGYADLEKKRAVTPQTLFELASCSKAFTALAVLRLAKEGMIDLDAAVSLYLPWFYVEWSGVRHDITLRQLLHHTSGIPARTISDIPISGSEDALVNTVRNIVGVRLDHAPGSRYEYATVNYDILGAIIESVTGKSFEEYMRLYVFEPLGLRHTVVGVPGKNPLMASGYKIGFFAPRRYDAPLFRGNNPAAYIVSNGSDMARWLGLQMGLVKTEFAALLQTSWTPDLSVTPQDSALSSYAMGWIVNQYRSRLVYHTGLNPAFSAYIAFRPDDKVGIVLLANCSSNFTSYIGNEVMGRLSGRERRQAAPPRHMVDLVCSVLSFALGLYLLGVLVAGLIKIIGAFRGRITFEPLTWKKLTRFSVTLVASTPYLLGIYLLPGAIARVSWQTAIIWGPYSFWVAITMLLITFAVSYIFYFTSLIFPYKNKYVNQIPVIIVLGILTGLANTSVLFLITTSFFSNIKLGYLIYYFFMAYSIYVIGAKLVRTKMIHLTNNITLDLRIDLIRKLLDSVYQEFETLKDGRIFTTLNGDTAVLAGSARLIIGFTTSLITSTSAFLYLSTISFTATLVVLMVVVIMAGYYYLISKIARRYMEEARDTQNVYMSLLNHMIRGFRELSIHWRRKKEFEEDLIGSCREFRSKSITAALKFLHSGLIGNSFVMIILGMLSIVLPRVATNIKTITLISFVMVLLYLIGPINGLLAAIPGITQLKVSWDRIKEFVRDIGAEGDDDSVKQFIRDLDRKVKAVVSERSPLPFDKNQVESITTEGLKFQYKGGEGDEHFSVGPIDLGAKKGEIVFIIGGNGSGKTTLAHLLTGLYVPDGGSIKINGKEIPHDRLGEYFSTVFSNYHLFEKLYDLDLGGRDGEVENYLKMLNLREKVRLENGAFSTLNLSGGQRKRLALLQCYLEDCPIYLFDEVASDQDPEFRRFFYRHLLLQMKERGKIVFAVTHDDHYFDVADTIVKMDMGKIDFITDTYQIQLNKKEAEREA